MVDFTIALSKTLIHEGGYQNYPHDHANFYNGINYGTKFGITPADVAKYFPELISDPNCVRNLTPAQATECYQKGWWNPLYASITDEALGEKLFDMGVLMGVEESVKLLQISMKEDGVLSAVSDGKFGPVTLAQVNASGSLSRYRTVLLNHAMNILNNNPGDASFIQDWVRRIKS